MAEANAEHGHARLDALGQTALGVEHPWRALGHARGRAGNDDPVHPAQIRELAGSGVDFIEGTGGVSERFAHQLDPRAPTLANGLDWFTRDDDGDAHRFHPPRSVAERGERARDVAERCYASRVKIAALRFKPFDVALREPFGIASGAQLHAANVLVELTLSNGVVGIGEAAPFPAVNGETQASVLAHESAAQRALQGLDARRYRRVSSAVKEVLGSVPSACAGVETALFDALCRSSRTSLWAFFGGSDGELTTDITIPTGDADHAARSAQRAAETGFDTLKVKVGGAPLELDVWRVRAIHSAAPKAELILDANASFTAEAALNLLDAVGSIRERVALFEQPCAADDLSGLAEVQQKGRVPVAADESARSARDVARLALNRAAAVVNIKIMKTGLVEAWDMIACARAHGLGLMVGGMVETELAMTTSACLAGGIGGFRFVDLDTPLFMAARPLRGGFDQSGPKLRLEHIEEGHGVAFVGEPSKAC